MTGTSNNNPTRRTALATLAGASVVTPYLWTRSASAAQQLVVRTPGGVFDDVKRETVYEPFRKATGIEIVPVPATVAKLLAMFRSGQMEIDLIDTGDDTLLQLDIAGALMPLDYSAFKFTNPEDLDPAIKRKAQVGNFVYAMIMGYHTSAYPKGKEPKSWAEFWDIKAFPGPRTLADMASGAPNLEFALIADGVPAEKLYPLDIERAFKSMSRVRPAVPKFWDTGALSTQMLADKEVVLAAVWSTRLGRRHRQGRAARRAVESKRGAGAGLRHPERLAQRGGREAVHRFQPQPRRAGQLDARLQGDPGEQEGVRRDGARAPGPDHQAALDRPGLLPQHRVVGRESHQGECVLVQVDHSVTIHDPAPGRWRQPGRLRAEAWA